MIESITKNLVLKEVPVKVQTTLKNHEGNLIAVFGNEELTKHSITEKYTNVKVVLYYYKNQHIATYNKETKTAFLFY